MLNAESHQSAKNRAPSGHANAFSVEVASLAPLDVRSFRVVERMSSYFEIEVVAYSEDASLDSEGIVGKAAAFEVRDGRHPRIWKGLCNHFEQVDVAPQGLSSYRLIVVPTLWLLTQRRNYRIFQQLSEPDIALTILREWGIEPVVRLERAHKTRKYRVQYGESDYAFISRILEDAGVAFYFDEHSELVLNEVPQSNEAREELPFHQDAANHDGFGHRSDYATAVKISHRVRPGKYTIRDHDYRQPASYPLLSEAKIPDDLESRLERFHYVDGAFLFGTSQGASTPSADDRGKTRHDEVEGSRVARKRLEAKRSAGRRVTFTTNAQDVSPGTVVAIGEHPHAALGSSKLLVLSTELLGDTEGVRTLQRRCIACSAELPYRPPLSTPKPRVMGVESATVVGRAGEEIHTDEFGRIRVHFHWDRYSQMDERSSCWIHVNQPWAGAGFGGITLPRVGQEVIVEFIHGDPDRPVVVGRLYTGTQPVPYSLPGNKTQSGLRSNSSPGGGGYNELMFEDSKGNERVNIQAEKDMSTLVKHDQTLLVKHDQTEVVKHDRRRLVENDETTVIVHDRTEEVQHDETLHILNDRKEKVDHDETIVIGHDRKEQVQNDEAIEVLHDRMEHVAHDETVAIDNNRAHKIGVDMLEIVGKNRMRQVGKNQVVEVGDNSELKIGESQVTVVGADRTTEIAKDDATTVGKNQSLNVGHALSINVGKSASTSVALSSSEQVGAAKSTLVGGAYSISVGGISSEQVGLVKSIVAGAMISIKCGASSITMDAAGNITIAGVNVVLTGKTINLN
jgi:type VI secretion system secreted protein VgrG